MSELLTSLTLVSEDQIVSGVGAGAGLYRLLNFIIFFGDILAKCVGGF